MKSIKLQHKKTNSHNVQNKLCELRQSIRKYNKDDLSRREVMQIKEKLLEKSTKKSNSFS